MRRTANERASVDAGFGILFTVVSLLAGLFALCGAAVLPVNPDAGSALVGCQSTN